MQAVSIGSFCLSSVQPTHQLAKTPPASDFHKINSYFPCYLCKEMPPFQGGAGRPRPNIAFCGSNEELQFWGERCEPNLWSPTQRFYDQVGSVLKRCVWPIWPSGVIYIRGGCILCPWGTQIPWPHHRTETHTHTPVNRLVQKCHGNESWTGGSQSKSS